MRLFDLVSQAAAPPPSFERPQIDGRDPALPDGIRVYAIGDIHGRLDLLRELEARIARELVVDRPGRGFIVYLGDYVDRGPASRGVIEHFLQQRPLRAKRVLLCGNHDIWLRGFVSGGPLDDAWLLHGGEATLASYGIDPRQDASSPMRAYSLRQRLAAAIPAPHRRFLAELLPSVEFGDYFFCHAGIRPGRPLDQQTLEDLVWIREPFLSHRGGHGRIIVHGHTIVEAPQLRTNRIGIDTGAVWSGRLTALALEGTTMRFLSTGPA